MAKSSRSKSQRANRAVKRERYAVKEQARLQKIVELAKETTAAQPTKEIYLPPEAVQKAEKTEAMAVDGAEQENVAEDGVSSLPMGVGRKTAHGNYPSWMNSRAIKKAKRAAKKKSAQSRKGKRAGAHPWKK